MTVILATLALALLAGIGFAAATSLVAALAWLALRHWLRRRHPAMRARAALAVATAPTLLPALLVALCFSPGVLGLLGLHADHCVRHPDHFHLCLVHPAALLTTPLAGFLVAAGALLGVTTARGALRVARARRDIAQLRLGSSRGLDPGVGLVESDQPFSLTAGLARSEIFVSGALAEALPSDQLEVVLEHERAHVRRRDALRRLLARALSPPLLPPLRREILAELALATERACDEEAAGCLGDRLRVAEAILAVERLLAGAAVPANPAFLAFGGSSVPERVRGLLGEPGCDPPFRAVWWTAGALVAAAWLLADPLHHATEHLLGILFGGK